MLGKAARPESSAKTNAPVNICFITNIFPPDIGGPATYVSHLAEELHERGHTVAVIATADDPADTSAVFPFPVHKVSRQLPVWRRYLALIRTALRVARSADVIYVNGADLPAIIAGKLLRKPRALKVVGDFAWEYAIRQNWDVAHIDAFQTERHAWRVEFIRALQRFYARNAHVVITPSNYVKSLVVGWGVPGERVQVIYNALTAAVRVDATQAEAKAELGLNFPTVMTVARLYAWKNVDELIDLVPQIDPAAKLVIVGDGPEQAALEARARAQGVAERVVFVGRVPHAEVPLYIRAADVFVLNTQYEGLSHTLLEVRSVGVPIVTTAVGGNFEVIEHGKSGILTPLGDLNAMASAINELLADPAQGARLCAAARRGLDYFVWPRLVGETEAVLRRLAGERPLPDMPHERKDSAHEREGSAHEREGST